MTRYRRRGRGSVPGPASATMPRSKMAPSEGSGSDEEPDDPLQEEPDDDGSDSDAVPEITEQTRNGAEERPAAAPAPPRAAGQKRARKTKGLDPDEVSSDDEAAIQHQLPRHAVSVPQDEPDGPVDAFKAAVAARRAGAAVAAASGGGGNGGGASAAANGGAPSRPTEAVPKVVDPALRKLAFLQSAHKYSAVGTLPMDALVHGLIQDDDGKTFPAYDITWDEFRCTGTKRKAWLDSRLQEDPTRVYQTLMIFELVEGAMLESKKGENARKKPPKYQACLPGKLAGPDPKSTTEQKAKMLSEYLGNDDWNVAIALPAEAVAQLYKMPNCALPSALDPNTAADVVYGVIDKMEDYAAKDPRVTIYKVAPEAPSQRESGGTTAAAKKARMAKPGSAAAVAAADAAPQRSIVGCWATVRTSGGEAPAAAPAAAPEPPEAAVHAESDEPAVAPEESTAKMSDLSFVHFTIQGQRVHHCVASPGHRLVSATQSGNHVSIVTEPIA